MPDKTPKHDNPGLFMPPPIWLGGALALAFALEWLAPMRFLERGGDWQFWIGVALTVAALALGLWAFGTFGRAGTNVNPERPATTLVTAGPFRFIRNPMYLGFPLILAGVSLAGGLEWGLVLIPLLWLSLHFFVVRREERYLLGKFGEPYAQYCRRVRRWGLF